MIARACLIPFARVLTGCGPASDPALSPSSPGDESPLAADLLANEPLAGAWESVGEGATSGVLFTSSGHPDTLTIGCNSATRRAMFYFDVDDALRLVRVLAVFFGGQDHQRAMLRRLSIPE